MGFHLSGEHIFRRPDQALLCIRNPGRRSLRPHELEERTALPVTVPKFSDIWVRC